MVDLKIKRDMYDETKTSVKRVCREMEDFTVKVHRKSVSNPYVFSLYMSLREVGKIQHLRRGILRMMWF